jgi:hypothetical protein
MKQKYFILAFMFLCMLCGQESYALTSGESNIDEWADLNNNGIPDVQELDEVVITAPGDSHDPCDPSSSSYNYYTCNSMGNDSGNPCDPYSSAYNLSQCMGDSGDPCDPYSSAYNYNVCYGSEPDGDEFEDPAVTNNITDPCLKNAVDRIISGSDLNPFSKFINGPFFREEYQSLTFNQYYNASENGIKDSGRQDERFNQVIELNLAALANASQEFIAATIYHEIIHAIFASQGIKPSAQHEIMASDTWRKTISDQLRLDFPNLSQEDADALAWDGLGQTSQWQTMINNDNANNTGVTGDIALVNRNHKNVNNSTNGNYGTSCTN